MQQKQAAQAVSLYLDFGLADAFDRPSPADLFRRHRSE